MIEQIGHPEMYERLVRKHAATYRMRLVTLILRREAALIELSAQVSDMGLEAERYLGPELQGLRDDARFIHARHEASQRELRSAAELAALKDRLSSSESAILNLEQEIERTSRQLQEYGARAHRAEQEVAGLRTSFSWRMTGPLRRIYALVLKLESRE